MWLNELNQKMEKYSIEHYTNPELSYHNSLIDKLKVGHLIYDNWQKRIVLVDIEVLKKILEHENKKKETSKPNFVPLDLTHEWLVNVFNFEAKHMSTNGITVYTSARNGMKVHGQGGQFFVGVTIREKFNSKGWKGTHVSKPPICFVNELMDYCFLLKRDMITFNEYDLAQINMLMKYNL